MNGENDKSKIEGWRKMGIGMAGITALSLNPTMDFKIAVIIGVITLAGIACQGLLDYVRRPTKIT